MVRGCAALGTMQGIRCGARRAQRMECELVKLCALRGKGVVSWWRNGGVSAVYHERRPFPGLMEGLRCGAMWCRPPSAAPVAFAQPRSQFCSSYGSESFISFKNGTRQFGAQFQQFTSRSGSGLGHGSRVASAPRAVRALLPNDVRSEGSAEELLCPGCGIEMQDTDPKAPGFFQEPTQPKKAVAGEVVSDELLKAMKELEAAEENEENEQRQQDSPDESEFWLLDEEETRGAARRRSKKAKVARDKLKMDKLDSEKPVVCARCHALRNYGKVKDETVENLLPDFDFEQVVGDRLRKSIGRRAVVLMVIDAVDFDGSFPRMAATLLADAERELGGSWKEGKAGNVPRLVIVLNKVDLLPGQISPVRLEQWSRRRARAGGVTQISGVHIVSAYKGWGLDKLAKQITEMAGPRGDVWVIGAQNVGKSSLINALGKLTGEEKKEEKRKVFLTEAAVPGTTVGILKIEGILPGRARVLDTPGLLHPHQITTRLTREEQKLVQIRKILKPRTFRVKVGHAISVGGLMRLTVVKAPADSIYATIWASAFIPCHMGQAEKSDELFERHVGDKLTPPLSKDRLEDLGRWVGRTVQVTGSKWDQSSVDIAVAGVGWFALALSGNATLEIHTYEGVAVTIREAMVYDLAAVFEKPGFTAVKTPSKTQLGAKSTSMA